MPYSYCPPVKRWIHLTMLVVSLVVLIPGACLGAMLFLAAVGTGFSKGFSPSDFVAFPLLILPAFIAWMGILLCFRLRAGFSRGLRNRLLGYHGLNLCYCGMWLLSPVWRDGLRYDMFSDEAKFMGFALLIVPVIVTAFTRSDGAWETPNRRCGELPADSR